MTFLVKRAAPIGGQARARAGRTGRRSQGRAGSAGLAATEDEGLRP